MLRSSIDLGTNTCLLLVAECESGAVTRVIHDQSTVVRLGQGVDLNRRLHPEAMERTLQCLKGYAERLKSLKLDPAQTVAVATSQARDAQNFLEFQARVKVETGFQLNVLTGDQEAKASFYGGLLPQFKPADCAIIDIGGGSTEFMALSNDRLLGQSLDVGSVRFTERYLKSDPVKDAEFWNCKAAVDEEFLKMVSWRKSLPPTTELVAVAGTATWLALWHLGLEHFDASQIDGLVLTRGDLHRLTEELKWRTVAERTEIPGMENGRADVILAGALILWRALEILDFAHCRISTRGLRFGVLNAHS